MVKNATPVIGKQMVRGYIADISSQVLSAAFHLDTTSEIYDPSATIVILTSAATELNTIAEWLKKSVKKKSINSSKKKTKLQSGHLRTTKT